MKSFGLPLLAAAVFAGSLFAADPTSAAFGRLRDEIAKLPLKLKAENPAMPGGSIVTYLASVPAKIQSDFEQGNFAKVDESLRDLARILPTPRMAKVVEELLALSKAAHEQQDQATLAKVGALLARAPELCSTAKSAKELDSLLSELAEARRTVHRNGSTAALDRAYLKTSSAFDFVRRWQDYLVKLQAGDLRDAASILSDLASDPSSYQILPRSELMARVSSLKVGTASASLSTSGEVTILSLEDLPQAIQTLRRNTSAGVGPA